MIPCCDDAKAGDFGKREGEKAEYKNEDRINKIIRIKTALEED